jgi:hypothetical protein
MKSKFQKRIPVGEHLIDLATPFFGWANNKKKRKQADDRK